MQNVNLTIKTLVLLTSAAALLSCTKTSPKLVPFIAQKADKAADQGQTITFSPKLDILFVVDDSGSMSGHQRDLATNIPQFTSALVQNRILDYHIGVITTSVGYGGYSSQGGDGRLVGHPAFVDRTVPNADTVLAANLNVGIDGSSTEMAFDPVVLALSAPLINSAPNATFYRPDAALAVIFVTDAEDQSTRNGEKDLYDFLLQLKHGDRNQIFAFGALIPTGDTSGCARDDESTTPVRIEEFLKRIGGQEFGLCDADFGTKLADAALNLVEKVGRVLYLTRPPIVQPVNTLVVTYGTQVVPEDPDTGWFFDSTRNALHFGPHLVWSDQPPGTQVQVTFEVADYEHPKKKHQN